MTSSGKAALITGATRGIGREVALAFARRGLRVAVAGRDADTLATVADEARRAGSPEVLPLELDVTDESAIEASVRRCLDAFGALDVLVNNAGIAESAKFTDTTLQQWRRIMAVDAEGPFLLTRAVLPGMLERGSGAVISIASVSARVGMPYVAAYTAAKHALLGMTRSLAAEYARSGVTFNCVCPHYVDTPMTRATVDNIVERTGRTVEEATRPLLTPQHRLIDPAEVAAICLLLASPEGRSITGQAINVDGGHVQA